MINGNDQTASRERPPTVHSRSRLSSYNFLLRLSKHMGGVAARSFIEFKDFLSQDIRIRTSDGHFSGLPHVHLLHRKEEDDGTGERSPTGEPAAMKQHEAGDKSADTTDEHESPAKREKERAAGLGETELDSASERLEKIVSQSHEVLAEANTVFPMTLFPHTVVVDRTKVTIIKRDFFLSSDTMTFRIEDVLNAEVTVGPLFGSLVIASRVMSTTDHFRIDHFWRKDAIRLKCIIQGYVIAQHNKIDVAHLTKDELINTLTELGHHRSI